MLRSFYSFFLIVFSFVLASCASVDDKSLDFRLPEKTVGIQKFPAWQQDNITVGSVNGNQAIRGLLRQADTLIVDNELELASDKLERLLRIEPTYAQAWSRLAWISLENNRPDRTRQMAQRSNSYAHKNKLLKKLNWLFIREAAQLAGNDEAVNQAEKMIMLLNESTGDL